MRNRWLLDADTTRESRLVHIRAPHRPTQALAIGFHSRSEDGHELNSFRAEPTKISMGKHHKNFY
jgi:hypothetical protein